MPTGLMLLDMAQQNAHPNVSPRSATRLKGRRLQRADGTRRRGCALTIIRYSRVTLQVPRFGRSAAVLQVQVGCLKSTRIGWSFGPSIGVASTTLASTLPATFSHNIDESTIDSKNGAY